MLLQVEKLVLLDTYMAIHDALLFHGKHTYGHRSGLSVWHGRQAYLTWHGLSQGLQAALPNNSAWQQILPPDAAAINIESQT